LGVGTATTPLAAAVAGTLAGGCVAALVVAVVAEVVVAACDVGCSVVAVTRLVVVGAAVPAPAAPAVGAVVDFTHTNEFFTLVHRSGTPFTVVVLFTAVAAHRNPARAGTALVAFGFVAALAGPVIPAAMAMSAAIDAVVAIRLVGGSLDPMTGSGIMNQSMMRSSLQRFVKPRPTLRILRVLSGRCLCHYRRGPTTYKCCPTVDLGRVRWRRTV
jgi:hypothetical protein